MSMIKMDAYILICQEYEIHLLEIYVVIKEAVSKMRF
jgi:hypothetical protein